MKKIVASLIAAFALMGGAPVFAQEQALDPAAVAAANDLFDAMHYREMMGSMIPQLVQGMAKAMHDGAEARIKNDSKATPEQKKAALAKMEAELPAAMNQVRTVLADPGLVDEMMAATVPMYARTFSADELKQLAVFYRSPVGVKVLTTMPQLMGEGMKVGQQIMMRRLQPMLEQAQAAGK